MTIYILNLIMIVLYWLLYKMVEPKSNNIKRFFVILITVQLIIILALRHPTVGVDVLNYLSHFRLYTQKSFGLAEIHRFEMGYKLLNKIISLFTTNEQLFLAIIAILSIVPVGRFIYKYSKMPFLSFLIYIAFNYYGFVFSGLRQAIAYGIIFISYDYIKERKLVRFLVSVILASLFHRSALIFLPAYFLYRVKINGVVISYLVLFNIFLFVFRKQVFTFIINNFYSSYLLVESMSYNWLLFCTIILLLSSLVYKDVIAVSSDNNGLYMFLTIGISLMLFASVGTNVMRVADYYYMYVIIFIPEVLTGIGIKDKKLVPLIGCLVIFGLILVYFYLVTGSAYQIVPYKFFWK